MIFQALRERCSRMISMQANQEIVQNIILDILRAWQVNQTAALLRGRFTGPSWEIPEHLEDQMIQIERTLQLYQLQNQLINGRNEILKRDAPSPAKRARPSSSPGERPERFNEKRNYETSNSSNMRDSPSFAGKSRRFKLAGSDGFYAFTKKAAELCKPVPQFCFRFFLGTCPRKDQCTFSHDMKLFQSCCPKPFQARDFFED